MYIRSQELEALMLRNRLDIDNNILRRNVYYMKSYKSIALIASYSKSAGDASKYIPRFLTGDVAEAFILYTSILKPIISTFDAILSCTPCTTPQVRDYLKQSNCLDYLFTTPYGTLLNSRQIRRKFKKGFHRFYNVDFHFSEYRQVGIRS